MAIEFIGRSGIGRAGTFDRNTLIKQAVAQGAQLSGIGCLGMGGEDAIQVADRTSARIKQAGTETPCGTGGDRLRRGKHPDRRTEAATLTEQGDGDTDAGEDPDRTHGVSLDACCLRTIATGTWVRVPNRRMAERQEEPR